MSDKTFLKWLENRIVFEYGESPNTDFVRRLRAIHKDMPLTWSTPKAVGPLSQKIIDELQTERVRQRLKGYTDDQNDNTKDLDDWCDDIIAYATWAKQMARMGSPDKYRNRMKQIATMAAAACDSYDRTAPKGRWFGRDADVPPVLDERSIAARDRLDSLGLSFRDKDCLWRHAEDWAEAKFISTHGLGQHPDKEKIVKDLTRKEYNRLTNK